jgi:hypothetical protein
VTGRIVDRLAPLAVLVAGVGVCLLRSPLALVHPELYAEDGHVWFQQAYNSGWFVPLEVAHTGYLQTFPRLVADLGLHVPLERVPLLFVVFAVAAQVLPAGFVASKRLASVVPSRWLRLLLAAAYLALPNSREVNANLTNAQWHLALLAVLVVLAEPATGAWRVADVLAVGLSGLTGPYCIALLPVAAIVSAVRRRRWSLVLLAEVGAVAVIQLYELATSSRGHFAGLGVTWRRFVEIAGDEIVGGTVLGQPRQLEILRSHDDLVLSTVMLAGGELLAVAAAAFGPLELKMLNLFAACVVGASLLTPVGSLSEPQWLALAFDPQMRYWFFPTVALVADAVWLATRRRPRGVTLVGLAAVVATAALAVPADWSYRPLPRVDWRAEIRAFDAAPPGEPFVFSIVPARWKMTLNKRA